MATRVRRLGPNPGLVLVMGGKAILSQMTIEHIISFDERFLDWVTHDGP